LDAARALRLEIHIVPASNERDIDAAFATIAQRRGARSWLLMIRISLAGVINSLRSLRDTHCLRCILRVRTWQPADWQVTKIASPTRIGRPAFTPGEFSKVKNLLICPLSNRPNLSW
jgi:hypothetical protein